MIHIPQAIARIPLLRGVFRLVLMGYARLFKRRFVIERRMGLELLLDRDNIIDWQLFIAGKWERPQFAELFGLATEQLRRRKADAVFLDVGAHWGLYALAAHQSGMFSRIVAFEPDPISFAQLHANLFLNQAQNAIEPLELAASSRERNFALEPGDEHNRGATRVIDPDTGHPATCRGVTIDSLFDFTGKLLVIKIDVESHEPEVLEGMKESSGEESLHPAGRGLGPAGGRDRAALQGPVDHAGCPRHPLRARHRRRFLFRFRFPPRARGLT